MWNSSESYGEIEGIPRMNLNKRKSELAAKPGRKGS